NFSEKTAELIDLEVKKIINGNYERARELLEKNKTALKNIAETLLDKEVLTSEEIEAIIKGKTPLPRKKPARTAPTRSDKAQRASRAHKASPKRNTVKASQ
ncbi:MAG: cell division protein FtsH, partial [Candidatus Aminicenantales bacterium]